MAIDPTLAQAIINPPQFKMPDPMVGMGNALNNAMLIDKLGTSRRERESRNAMSAAYRDNLGADGKYNQAGVARHIADAGYGDAIPGEQAKWYEIDKTRAEVGNIGANAAETRADTITKRTEIWKQRLVNVQNQAQYGEWFNQMYNDDVLGPEMKKVGINPADVTGRVMQMPTQQFATLLNETKYGKDALENQYTEVDKGGTGGIYRSPKIGGGAPKEVATWTNTKDPNSFSPHWVQDYDPVTKTIKHVPATPGMVTRPPKVSETPEEREVRTELAERGRAVALLSQALNKKLGIRTDVMPGSGDLEVMYAEPMSPKAEWLLQKELDAIGGTLIRDKDASGKTITKIMVNYATTAKAVRDHYDETLAPKAPKAQPVRSEVDLRIKARAQAIATAKSVFDLEEVNINKRTEEIFQDLMKRNGAGAGAPGAPSLRDQLKADGLL